MEHIRALLYSWHFQRFNFISHSSHLSHPLSLSPPLSLSLSLSHPISLSLSLSLSHTLSLHLSLSRSHISLSLSLSFLFLSLPTLLGHRTCFMNAEESLVAVEDADPFNLSPKPLIYGPSHASVRMRQVDFGLNNEWWKGFRWLTIETSMAAHLDHCAFELAPCLWEGMLHQGRFQGSHPQ